MIQNIIKRMLRKWLKKKIYRTDIFLSTNVANFEWVYNSPLNEWRDRIWVVKQYRRANRDKVFTEYLYS